MRAYFAHVLEDFPGGLKLQLGRKGLLSVHMLLCMPQAGMREVRTTVGAGLKLQLSRLKGCALTHAAERAAAD